MSYLKQNILIYTLNVNGLCNLAKTNFRKIKLQNDRPHEHRCKDS